MFSYPVPCNQSKSEKKGGERWGWIAGALVDLIATILDTHVKYMSNWSMITSAPDNSGFRTILDLSLLHVPINHSKNEAILNKGVFTGIYGILCHNRHFLISQNYEVKMNYRFYSI